MAEQVFLSKGDYLMREGEESTEMYYVQEGILGVFKRKLDQEHQIGTIYAGELVGEMSFLDEDPRSATVKTITDCELLIIPHHKYDEMKKFHFNNPRVSSCTF